MYVTSVFFFINQFQFVCVISILDQREHEMEPVINGHSKQTSHRSDDMPDILIDNSREHEQKSLLNSRKQWPSGALSRPDIFYGVRNKIHHRNRTCIDL